MQGSSPLVSVITATYNRSNVLRYAIGSLVNSTFGDWELLVVGDCCTDDTEEVVASFEDPRIRYTNLERNTGDQSGPNNEGFRRAKGRYIAYLNHDDLWMPDHLETALGGIEETRADLVFTLGIDPKNRPRGHLLGAAPNLRYDPSMPVPASLWLLKRELIEEIGDWRHYRESYTVPSQDFLLRAWRAGKELRLIPRVTVIAIQSGIRANVYAQREFEENRRYFEKILNEPGFREELLAAAALELTLASKDLKILPPIRRALINILKRVGLMFNITPIELMSFLKSGRRGAFIDRLRKRRGLPKLKQ